VHSRYGCGTAARGCRSRPGCPACSEGPVHIPWQSAREMSKAATTTNMHRSESRQPDCHSNECRAVACDRL
jgi:hypothetical protein